MSQSSRSKALWAEAWRSTRRRATSEARRGIRVVRRSAVWRTRRQSSRGRSEHWRGSRRHGHGWRSPISARSVWCAAHGHAGVGHLGHRGSAGSHHGCGRLEQVLWQGLDGRRDTVGLCLLGEHSFGLVSVALALSVLLVGVLDRDLLAHHVLAVHAGNGRV